MLYIGIKHIEAVNYLKWIVLTLDVWNSEGFGRHCSGDKEREGISLILMVVGTTLIWVGELKDIQGALFKIGEEKH